MSNLNPQHLQLLVLRWPAGQAWAYLSRATTGGREFLRFINLDLPGESPFAALTRHAIPDSDGMCEVAFPATHHDHERAVDGGR